jgi:DNA-binding NtrC family response regulator
VQRPVGSLVLVVDDEADVGDTLKGLLEESGYRVLTVRDGESAIAEFSADPQSFSLVLLDMRMPGMNGLNTFLALQQIEPEVRVILSSGDAPADEVQALVIEGILSFIQKSYTLKQLLTKVNQVTRNTLESH